MSERVDDDDTSFVENEVLQPASFSVIQAMIENQRAFLKFIQRKVGSRAIAEDILQSSFVKVIEKGSRLHDQESALAWFYTTLRNAIVDYYRHTSAENRALAKETAKIMTDNEWDSEMKGVICTCMHAILPTLKSEYAHIVQRIDLEEGSLEEFATQEGLSKNNATVRLHRARRALKMQLEKSCGACATHGCLDCHCRSAQATHCTPRG